MSRYPEALHFLYDQFYWVKHIVPGSGYKINNNNDAEIKPFFVIGSGRSGTTLLRRVLVQVKGVHIPPETYVLGLLVKLYRQNRIMKWENLVDLILATIEYHHDFDTFQIPSLGPLASQLKKVPKSRRTLAYILDQFYRYHAHYTGQECSIWGDKTPYNTLSIERIGRIFPSAKYIFLIRNGYDVAYSFVKNGLFDNYVDAAKRWKVSNEKALKFLKKNPDRVFKVKYEDFASSPVEVGLDIFKFLELKFDKSYVEDVNKRNMFLGDVEKKEHHYNIYNKVTKDNIGKGKSNMNTEEIREVSKVIKPMCDLLGYDG